MPLNPTGLRDSLEDLFSDPGANTAVIANAWGSAMTSYAAAVVPPSTTVSAAGVALSSTLVPIFSSPGTLLDKAGLVDAAIVSWAVTIGGGMAPANGFLAAPLVGVLTAMTPPWPETHEEAAQKWADMIDLYTKSCLAIPISGTGAIPWS